MMIAVIILLLAAFWIAIKFAYKLYPDEPLKDGGNVNIYIDGRYNRNAMISQITPDYIIIYNKLPLPVCFRGKFYSVGYMNDGHSLMFLGRKRLFFLAHVAELIRKIAGTPEYQDQSGSDVILDEISKPEKESEPI